MLVSSSHPYAIALIMAFLIFSFSFTPAGYVENMQYHHVKDFKKPIGVIGIGIGIEEIY